MGLKDRYKKCMELVGKEKHAYCMINNSPHIEDEALRVGTNIFGNFGSVGKFPLYFT